MKKQQLLLTCGGLILLAVLWFAGKTINPVTPKKSNTQPALAATPSFDIDAHHAASQKQLSASQTNQLNALEKELSSATPEKQEKIYQQLAAFWHDSLHNHELYVFYISKAAMLVNSEKNLTFAARQILDEFRNERDPLKRGWEAGQAISLLQKAIELNPGNDSLKVDLGSCYVFGRGMAGDPQETMKGIQQLLQVVKKDSTNMQAQLVLGIGGVISSQYDKAIERLQTVIRYQPTNQEAITWLAEAYAAKGEKENAVKWLNVSKQLMNNPEYSREIDKRIAELKQK